MVGSILKAALAGWATGLIISAASYAYVTKDLHPSRAGLERAVVEEFKGTQSLDEILKSQGFQTVTYYNGGIVASVNASLANACGTPQFAQNTACERYGEIPRQLEESAAARAKYDGLRNIFIGYLAGGIPVTFIWFYGVLPSVFSALERRRPEQQQAPNLISP